MANEQFRSGQDLDDEDSAASRAVGIRRGQIIQTHDAIQEALGRMEETQAEGQGSEIEQAIFPDPRPGKGNFNKAAFLFGGEIDEAVAAHQGSDRPEAAAGKRRSGFAAILPDLAEEAGEAAIAPAAGEAAGTAAGAGAAAGGAGLAAAGGLGVVAAIAAQQAADALRPEPQLITAPGGGKTVSQDSANLSELVDIQRKVSKLGLPTFGGVKTEAAGSRL